MARIVVEKKSALSFLDKSLFPRPDFSASLSIYAEIIMTPKTNAPCILAQMSIIGAMKKSDLFFLSLNSSSRKSIVAVKNIENKTGLSPRAEKLAMESRKIKIKIR